MMPQSTSHFATSAGQRQELQTHDRYSPNLLRAAIHYGRSVLLSWIDGQLLGALLWGKWGLFEPQGIQALKSSAVWCNGVV